MAILFFIGFSVVYIFSWIIWSLLAIIIFTAAVGIPWGIWKGFLYLTFNNIINFIAKIPFIGPILGFLFSIPFASVSIIVTIWAYVQVVLMGILTIQGYAGYGICNTFLEDYVIPLESDLPNSFIIARYYYEHMQWVWGGAGIMGSYFPWENGVMVPIHGTGPIGWVIKAIFLALPYTAMFIFPLFPVLWSFTMPISGALARLPSISQNGTGRD